MTPEKRDDVRATIKAFQPTVDLSKTPAELAYRQLYPDQVDYRSFLELWEESLQAPLPTAAADASNTPSEASLVAPAASPAVASAGGTAPAASEIPQIATNAAEQAGAGEVKDVTAQTPSTAPASDTATVKAA